MAEVGGTSGDRPARHPPLKQPLLQVALTVPTPVLNISKHAEATASLGTAPPSQQYFFFPTFEQNFLYFSLHLSLLSEHSRERCDPIFSASSSRYLAEGSQRSHAVVSILPAALLFSVKRSRQEPQLLFASMGCPRRGRGCSDRGLPRVRRMSCCHGCRRWWRACRTAPCAAAAPRH